MKEPLMIYSANHATSTHKSIDCFAALFLIHLYRFFDIFFPSSEPSDGRKEGRRFHHEIWRVESSSLSDSEMERVRAI